MRIWVKIGGCAGMAYKMEYTESVEPDRRGVVEGKGVRHLVGPKAVLFLLAPRRTCKVDKLAAQSVFNTPTKPWPAARESVARTPGEGRSLVLWILISFASCSRCSGR